MNLTAIVLWLVIGAVAGWLAGQLMRGRGLGLVGNIVVGIIGAFVGGWLLGGVLGISIGGGLVGAILNATVGAVVVLAVIGAIKRASGYAPRAFPGYLRRSARRAPAPPSARAPGGGWPTPGNCLAQAPRSGALA